MHRTALAAAVIVLGPAACRASAGAGPRDAAGPKPDSAGASVVAAGASHPDLAPFDRLMTSLLAERGVPGAALAVVKDGRLVLARGYGWADREAGRPVQPTSLFRIASLSKPITAAAVLGLAEAGRLRLDAKVFDLLGIAPHLPPGKEVDPRLRRVTVLQLLRHTGGFDRARSFDPMFRPIRIAKGLGIAPPPGPAAIIRYMWGRPLDFDPGARHAYSNFGYCVLGRVIEKASGRTYEAYVREHVLAPLGIRRMRLGRTLRDGRADGEVVYHDDGGSVPAVVGGIGEPVPRPYGGFCLEAMDAHGGWIASAVDLARFARAFRDPGKCPILGPASVRLLFARPPGRAGYEEDGRPKAVYYGCGWAVRPRGDGRANRWHAGGLPGTAALMVLRHDGLSWVVLFNARNGRDGVFLVDAIDPLLHRAADRVRRWPAWDLFPRYR